MQKPSALTLANILMVNDTDVEYNKAATVVNIE